MHTEMDENTLYVQMFGGFSMTWNGKLLTGGAKSSETQFVYLMQLLLHYRREGVGKELLKKVLFGDREINNIHHSIRNLIYNAKRKLKALGLPDVNYIEQENGIYRFTDAIRVSADTEVFEQKKAEAEKGGNDTLECYLDACRCYTGEFLPAQTGMGWVYQEARKYRGMFCACVEEAARILRKREDYFQLERLGRYASRIQPLSDWETITMEALVSLGRFDDARRFYDDTVDLYFKEQGLHPSQGLMDLMGKLGTQMEHRYDALDSIQGKLAEGGEEEKGGYLCPYPVFQGIYRMVERLMERGGQSVYLMLCTLVDSKGNPMKDGPALEDLSMRLGDAIRHSVRHSDAVNRYGKGQYLVLLVNTTREDCDIIMKRINGRFLMGRQRTGVKYYVKNVVCASGQ